VDLEETTFLLRSAGCVYAEEEAALLSEAASDGEGSGSLEALVARRVAGEPLEVIVGWADFGGLRVRIVPGVFVPRQRSMALVEASVVAAPKRLLDLGCGSGALAAAVRRRLPDLEVWAVDVDPAAVACAALNLPGVPGEQVLCGSWFEPLPASLRGTFDVILANAPYVPSAAVALMPPEARDHEPLTALDGGADGLDRQRVVIGQAPQWLRPGGRLVIEVGEAQVATATTLVEESGLRATVVTDADLGATVVIGEAA
jgi:release factor glutamine methyltransferase